MTCGCQLLPRSFRYPRLRHRLREATDIRNKLFHGQLTSKNLTRTDLLAFVSDIKAWCGSLADASAKEFKYDGFAWNSFQKSVIGDLSVRFRVRIANIAEYECFVRQHMQC